MERKEFYEMAYRKAEELAESNGFKVIIEDIKKLNSLYKGIVVIKEEKDKGLVIDLDSIYDRCTETGDYKKGVEEMTEAIMKTKTPDFKTADILDYEKAKEKLFIRLSNADNNGYLLDTVPHRQVCDLVVTYHLKLGESEEFMSTVVKNEMLKAYGIDEDKLYRDAVENSEKLFPGRIAPLGNVMDEILGMEPKEEQDASGLTVITNTKCIFGAAAILYPETVDSIKKVLGDNFYLLPSSIHEWLAIKAEGSLDVLELKDLVNYVNSAEVAPKDRLSGNVYRYNFEKKEIEKVA